MSMNVNGSTQQTGTEWFRNMKMQKPDRNAPEAQPPQADRAVNVTISREGLESLQNGGRTRTHEGVVKQKESIMQASKSIGAGYGYRLSEEAEKLKGQRDNGGAYSFSDRAADYVADGAGVKEMISSEFNRLASKAGSSQTAFTDVNKKP